jgi:hypothetical protein
MNIKTEEEKKMTKTCGDCKHYIAEMFHCQKNDVMAEAFHTCEDFDPKVITNGEKIIAGGNEALVEYRQKFICHICAYRFDKKCNGARCKDGLIDWLEQEAEDE